MKAEHNGKSVRLAFSVVPALSSPLLGKNACAKMSLIRLVYSVKYGNLIDNYDDVFRGWGCLPG